jgi:hypothetical protein
VKTLETPKNVRMGLFPGEHALCIYGEKLVAITRLGFDRFSKPDTLCVLCELLFREVPCSEQKVATDAKG